MEEILVPNILSEIELMEKQGKIKLFRYPNRPCFIPADNSDLIDKYICFDKQRITGEIDSLLYVYPEFREIVEFHYSNVKVHQK